MIQAHTGAVIGLSQWYAAFVPRADEARPAAGAGDALRLGPLTVFRAGEGCETASVGGGERAGSVVFDGYLFDRRALALELGLPDGPVSNAQLAASAYLRWGAGVFDRLDGCYLLAIRDGRSGRLLIGHDALGRHPVYYASEGGALWFGSNILALASSGFVSRRPNRLSLALAMLLFWPEAGQTYFESIRRLRPGHYLAVSSDGATSEHKYWDPLPDDDEPWMSDLAAREEFEPSLVSAVARCMELEPHGIMLSGGVDSVTVAALAAEWGTGRGRPPLVAVSGQSSYAVSGEEQRQSSVAEALGMPHDVSTTDEWTGGRNAIGLSLEATPALPSPSRIYWVGTYTRFYRRAADKGLNVLLTGSGGDNWLGVADTHAADLLRRFHWLELLRFMRADVSTAGASIRGSAKRLLWGSGLRPHLDTLWARVSPESKARYHVRKWHERIPGWVCPDTSLRQELVERLFARRTPALTVSGRAPASYYRHSLRSMSNPYMHYENETAHHLEAWSGVRLLSPYHDRRLVSFFNRISPRALISGDRYKGLLRPIVAARLPALGLERQRKDYPAEAERGRLRDLRRGVLAAWADHSVDELGRLGIVDPAAVPGTDGVDGKGFEELVQMFMLMEADRWVRTHTRG
jgi:asparagine synthetase B (glutamine-hydrolysing)